MKNFHHAYLTKIRSETINTLEIMKTFIGFLLIITIVFFILYPNSKSPVGLKRLEQMSKEQGYFEGQKDALQGKYHVKQINDSTFIWIDSPWKDKSEIIYFPQP